MNVGVLRGQKAVLNTLKPELTGRWKSPDTYPGN